MTKESNKPVKSTKNSNIRRCHDCGEPTINYRCQKCWNRIRIRGKYSTSDSVYDIESCRSNVYIK